jgi:type VI secretion system protein ImpA
MPVDTALIEALLVPVAGDEPAGRDLRYDPRYDQVKEARREDLVLPEKDGAPKTDRKIADYSVVMKLGRTLLETETKDLQLAAWITEALLKQQGLIGLATGLHAVSGILDTFWDGCFPSWDEDDPELRAAPLEWIGSKLDLPVRMVVIAPPGFTFLDYQVSRTVPSEADGESNKEKRELRETALSEGKPAPEGVDRSIADANKAFYKGVVGDVTAAAQALLELEKVADKRFGRDAPSFLRLRGALDDIKRTAGGILAQKLIDDPDPIVEEAVAETGAVAVDESGPQSPEPVNVADAARRIAVSSAYLRKLDPTAPGPYLAMRGLRWGELRATAATGDLNPRLLEAPATVIRSRLKGLLLDGKWPELLELCEVVMATGPGRGWLDLQRYALTACANLGPAYDAVAAALRDEIRVLLKAIPQLPEMTLMDDTPTANSETKAFLTEEQLLADSSSTEATPVEPGSGDASDEEVALQAALVQEGSTVRHGGLAAPRRKRAGPDPYDQAKAESAQGRARNGIELMLAEIAREQSARGRFLRQTQLAYIMVENGLDSVARPILEKLVQTIDERKLEEWESGPLVAQPMALLCRVMDRATEYSSDDRRQLYLRICALDAMQAMALGNG